VGRCADRRRTAVERPWTSRRSILEEPVPIRRKEWTTWPNEWGPFRVRSVAVVVVAVACREQGEGGSVGGAGVTRSGLLKHLTGLALGA
jgi:hypothetical protein